MNKRGSVELSVFVILGLVALAAIGGISYLFSSSQLEISAQSQTQREVVPLQIEPVQDYVDYCIQTLGIEALKHAGLHGGYVLDTDINSLRTNRREITRNSDAVYFDITSKETKIPYWYAIDCSNEPELGASCIFNSHAPSMQDVKSDIATYVDQNLEDCLGNFGDYSIIYDIKKQSDSPKTTIDFSENEMIVSTEYNIELNSQNSNEVYTLNYFALKIPTKFSQMYEIASQITKENANNRVVDNAVTNWIDAYSGLNNVKFLPPKYTFDVYGTPVIWTVEDAKTKYENILHAYMRSRFQVMGSKNYDDYSTGMLTSFDTADGEIATYNKMIFKNASANIKNFDVNFMTNPEWPIIFKINAKTNGVIRPESSGSIPNAGFLSGVFPEIQEYRNLYSVEFPLIINIVDNDVDEALFGDSYSFKFAWQSKIANNFPVNTSNNFDGALNDEFETQYCDPYTWNNNANLQFVDDLTNAPIPEITARVYGGIDCYLTNESNSNGVIVGLPIGIGNQLKVDYNEDYVLYDDFYYDMDPNVYTTLTIPLMKILEPSSVDFKKQIIFKDNYQYCYNDMCKQRCANNFGGTCFTDCQKDYLNYNIRTEEFIKNPVTGVSNCSYNITYEKCDNSIPAKCQKINASIPATPNSLIFFNVTKPQDFNIEQKIESVTGTFNTKLDGSEPSDGLQTVSFTLDKNDRDELITSGFVKGTYEFTFSYSEGSSYNNLYDNATLDRINSGTFDESELQNQIQDYDISDMGKVSVYSYITTIDNNIYRDMANLNLILRMPILDFTTLNENDLSTYDVFNYTFLGFVNDQPNLNAIPSDVFPNKPQPYVDLDIVRFEK